MKFVLLCVTNYYFILIIKSTFATKSKNAKIAIFNIFYLLLGKFWQKFKLMFLEPISYFGLFIFQHFQEITFSHPRCVSVWQRDPTISTDWMSMRWILGLYSLGIHDAPNRLWIPALHRAWIPVKYGLWMHAFYRVFIYTIYM